MGTAFFITMTYPVCRAASVVQEGQLTLPYLAAGEAFPLFPLLFPQLLLSISQYRTAYCERTVGLGHGP